MQTSSFSLIGARLAYLLTITRVDGTIMRVTNTNRQVTIGSLSWMPTAGLEIGDITETNDGTVPNLSFKVATKSNGTFDPYEIDLGLFERAEAMLEITNAANPVARDFQFIGLMKGDATYDLAGNASFEILNKFGLDRDILIRQYAIEDDVDFGDPRRSKIATFPTVEAGNDDLKDVQRAEVLAVGDRRRVRFSSAGNPSDYHNVYLEVTAGGGATASSAPSFTDGIGDTITDGTVTFTVRNAWARAFQVASILDDRHVTITVTEPRATATTWYAPGKVYIQSGFCKSRVSNVDAWDGISQIELEEPIGRLLTVGDWGEIAPDYDQTLDMAVSKYDNADNYRGFPHLTGAKVATSIFIPGTTVVPGPTDDPGAGTSYEGYAVEFAAGAD